MCLRVSERNIDIQWEGLPSSIPTVWWLMLQLIWGFMPESSTARTAANLTDLVVSNGSVQLSWIITGQAWSIKQPRQICVINDASHELMQAALPSNLISKLESYQASTNDRLQHFTPDFNTIISRLMMAPSEFLRYLRQLDNLQLQIRPSRLHIWVAQHYCSGRVYRLTSIEDFRIQIERWSWHSTNLIHCVATFTTYRPDMSAICRRMWQYTHLRSIWSLEGEADWARGMLYIEAILSTACHIRFPFRLYSLWTFHQGTSSLADLGRYDHESLIWADGTWLP